MKTPPIMKKLFLRFVKTGNTFFFSIKTSKNNLKPTHKKGCIFFKKRLLFFNTVIMCGSNCELAVLTTLLSRNEKTNNC
jgi:hypothetical protein